MADAEEDIPAEWGWPKQPFLPEDLKQHVLQDTQATQQELWNGALEARAIDSKLEDHMAEKVFANVLLNKEGTGEEKKGKVYEGIDPNAYKKGKWYRYLNYKGDCYVYVHNYTKDITATRPANFTDLTDEEKARIAKLGTYVKSLSEEVKRVYDGQKAIPIIYGTAETCEALKTFYVYDKHHQLLDATKLAKRITSGALEDCRKAIVAATSLGKTLCIYCGDAFPDFAEKVCVSKNKESFPWAVFMHGGLENDMTREKIYREEDKEAGQCPLRPGFRVCILVQYDGLGFEMSSMRKNEELPQKIPNFQHLVEIRCYSDADEAKVLELMRSGKEA